MFSDVKFQLIPADAQMLALVRYETDYGIFNHDADNYPLSLALVRFHWSEDTVSTSRLQSLMQRFADYGVGSKFCISWSDFLKMPRHECELMLEISSKRAAEAEKAAENELNALPPT